MGEKNFEVQFVGKLTCYNQRTGEIVSAIPGEVSISDWCTDNTPSKEIFRFEPHAEISFTASNTVWYPKTLCMSGLFRDIAVDMVKAYLRSGGSRRVAHLALYARRYHDRAKNLTRVYRHNMGKN